MSNTASNADFTRFEDLERFDIFRILPGGRWYMKLEEPAYDHPSSRGSILCLWDGKLGWLHLANQVYDVHKADFTKLPEIKLEKRNR